MLTRRWVWRQARQTLTLPETTAVEFNVDALDPVGPAETAAICEELAALVERFCGGRTRQGVIGSAQAGVPMD